MFMHEQAKSKTLLSVENWQLLVLRTASYERPASNEVIHELTQSMISEYFETIWAFPNENPLGRIALLSPPSHEEFYPNNEFYAAQADKFLKDSVAGEFGDITWYEVALLAERNIDMPKVLNYGYKLITGEDKDDVTITEFAAAATNKSPKVSFSGHTFDLDNFAPISYATGYISPFIRAIDSAYGNTDESHEGLVEKSAYLLWATTYLLRQYCDKSLEEVVIANLIKLEDRENREIMQGTNVEDPRWQQR
jgi:hypothetical protein